MQTIGVGLSAFLLFALLSCNSQKQLAASRQPSETIFPKGDKITNRNFVGNAWLKTLISSDSLNATSVGSVTFDPGARTKWHLHPGGQILLAMGGIGYYQEKGSHKRLLRKGDAIKCPPNVPHWHGASRTHPFVQIAITSTQPGPTVWLETVTDAEYDK